MNEQEKQNLKVVCPHCQSVLTVDRETGEILLSEKHEKKEFGSFDDALQVAREKEQQKSSLFEQAMELEKKRKELLEKKFEESRKQKQNDDSPPAKIFDFD